MGEGWDAAVLFAVYYTMTGTYFELPLISYNVTTPRRETNHGLDRPVGVKNTENNGASFLIKKNPTCSFINVAVSITQE